MTEDRRGEGEDVFETVALLTNGDNNCESNNVDSAVWCKWVKLQTLHWIHPIILPYCLFKHNARYEK